MNEVRIFTKLDIKELIPLKSIWLQGLCSWPLNYGSDRNIQCQRGQEQGNFQCQSVEAGLLANDEIEKGQELYLRPRARRSQGAQALANWTRAQGRLQIPGRSQNAKQENEMEGKTHE